MRVDVGIDPYIETVGASHSSCRVVVWGCGRLVAAPTGATDRDPFNVPLCTGGGRAADSRPYGGVPFIGARGY